MTPLGETYATLLLAPMSGVMAAIFTLAIYLLALRVACALRDRR